MIDTDGILSTHLFDKDVHEGLIEEDIENEDFVDYINEHTISEFNCIELTDDYADTFSSIADDPENPAIPLIRYLIALERCGMEDVEELIAMAKGHYADELEIPMSDTEEEYLEENGEEDE